LESATNILIVDDNVGLRTTLAMILRRKGYAVKLAGDGPEAIEHVKQRSFDIIFMDIKMPVMNGVETLKRIKQTRPESVVVMMTAYAVEQLIQDALREGAYDILYKPVDVDRILILMEQVKQEQQSALILIVDDDLSLCAVLKATLSAKGYTVTVASSGEEAIVKAQQAPYDIILIDVLLPTLSGLETFLRIRDANPHAVVIMMTAYRFEVAELVEQALRQSAYVCLYKPLDVEKLCELVEEISHKKLEQRWMNKPVF